MEMLDKRLNDKGKNWRHVFKALTVLDYILHAGSENVVIYFKDNLYIVKTLKEFVYVDDQGKDVGHNVRQKAKDITNLLQDEDRLRAERRQRGAMRDRMLGNIADHGLQGEDDFGGRDYNSSWRDQERRPTPRRNDGDEDADLQRALAESMQNAQDEDRRRSQQQREEDELQRALRLSEEEEAKRKREQEEANQRALMDDNFQLESNNQYAQQQQPQQTGFPLVDMNSGWNQQQLQPQYTSFNVSCNNVSALTDNPALRRPNAAAATTAAANVPAAASAAAAARGVHAAAAGGAGACADAVVAAAAAHCVWLEQPVRAQADHAAADRLAAGCEPAAADAVPADGDVRQLVQPAAEQPVAVAVAGAAAALLAAEEGRRRARRARKPHRAGARGRARHVRKRRQPP